MNVLMVLSGELSYEESLTGYQFAVQLDERQQVQVIAPPLPLGLWAETPFKTALIGETFEQTHFQQLVEEANPDLIVVADGPAHWVGAEGSRIPWEWLESLPQKVAFLDPLGLFGSGKIPPAPKQVAVIEPCPPNQSQNPLRWRRLDPLSLLGRHGHREQARRELGLAADARLVVLAFNPHQVMLACGGGFHPHFHEVVALIRQYLFQVDPTACLLAVGYSPEPPAALRQEGVTQKSLVFPSAADLGAIVLASDLLLVESMTHPHLLTARQAGIPAMVLGSQQSPETLPHLKGMGRDAAARLAECQALFPHVSFPFPSDHWTDVNPVEWRFRFYLADVLLETETVALLGRALTEPVPPDETAALGRTAAELVSQLTGSN